MVQVIKLITTCLMSLLVTLQMTTAAAGIFQVNQCASIIITLIILDQRVWPKVEGPCHFTQVCRLIIITANKHATKILGTTSHIHGRPILTVQTQPHFQYLRSIIRKVHSQITCCLRIFNCHQLGTVQPRLGSARSQTFQIRLRHTIAHVTTEALHTTSVEATPSAKRGTSGSQLQELCPGGLKM